MKRQLKPMQAVMPGPASQPAQFTAAEAIAVQAFSNASADGEQQRIAYRWILESACGLPIWPYRPEQRETDIALGRHFVGQQIIGITRVNISRLKQREEKNNG